MSKKTPPKFVNEIPYKTWKNKIDIWKVARYIPKEQKAIIVLIVSLEGNAKTEK